MKKRYFAAAAFQVLCLIAGSVISAILPASGHNPAYNNSTLIYTYVVLIMLAFIVVIEIVSVIKVPDSSIHTVYTSGSLILGFFFSYDMQEVINPEHSIMFAEAAEYIGYIAFNLILLSHLFLLNYLYKTDITRGLGIFAVMFSICDCALYFILKNYGLHWVAYILYLPAIIYFTAKVYANVIRNKKYDLTFIFTSTIIFCVFGAYINSFLFNAGVLKSRIYGIDTTYILIINLLYVCVYVTYLLGIQRQALAASEYKYQAEQMKTRLLREQMNPHFIFNSLISVKEAYHNNLESGDKAINYFSRHLRANVNALNVDLIPLNDELDIIENYIGLVNLKRQKPVNAIYNIEYDDFCVPVLSLQIFVENAINYARTDEREDGYIAISTTRCDGGTLVQIDDNGIGFDVNGVNELSCGIRNAKERFKLLLKTDVEIESRYGHGTKVKIIIPDGAEKTTEDGQ